MAGTAGKKARIKVATTFGGTYNYVAGADSISVSIDGTNVDDSEFGVDWMQRLQGLKDCKITVSGKLRVADTNGQLVIRAAFLNDTQLFVKFLPDDGTTANAGINAEFKVASWKVDPQIQDKQTWSADLEITGAVTLV